MATDNRSQVRRVLITALFMNLLLVAIKGVIGGITGSLSLFADALHSLTDVASSGMAMVANHFASPQPDREHPYGRQKFDALGALGVTAFLAVACFEILSSAVERIISGGEQVKVTPNELWILLIALGINIFISYYERYKGTHLGSSLLMADSMHAMSDIWTTILVIAGLIGIWLGDVWNTPQLQALDLILAFPVALLVFHSAWEIFKENLPWLVDHMAIPPEKIREISMNVPGVLNCHNIASRGVIGRQVFIEMHMIVDAPDVATAHKITEKVEAELEQKFSPVRILIHVEPPGYQSNHITYDSDSD